MDGVWINFYVYDELILHCLKQIIARNMGSRSTSGEVSEGNGYMSLKTERKMILAYNGRKCS